MEDKEICIVKDTIKKFVLKLRLNPSKSDILNILFTYYVKDPSTVGKDKTRPKIDCEGIVKRLSEDILLAKDSPWGVSESDAKLVKDFISKYGESKLKVFVKEYLELDLHEESKRVIQEENKKNTDEQIALEKIIKSELLTKATISLIKDKREFPYKNNKIGALYELGLNAEQVLSILNRYENLTVTKSYIDKIFTEKVNLSVTETSIKEFANKLIKDLV